MNLFGRFVVGVETGFKRITVSVFTKTPTRMEPIIFSDTEIVLLGQILEAKSPKESSNPTSPVEQQQSPIPSFSEVSILD